eukprot:TRINITY_DN18808_c0_g1_i2.p1 TRINITY_DN18808_c0_g1~~TRINITY_DN18808_c0_g1_i2.p1  ORF type:complete len:307 (+),score=62.82 TRINITY_DN18808_c0_g1_i2:113-1033(+)
MSLLGNEQSGGFGDFSSTAAFGAFSSEAVGFNGPGFSTSTEGDGGGWAGFGQVGNPSPSNFETANTSDHFSPLVKTRASLAESAACLNSGSRSAMNSQSRSGDALGNGRPQLQRRVSWASQEERSHGLGVGGLRASTSSPSKRESKGVPATSPGLRTRTLDATGVEQLEGILKTIAQAEPDGKMQKLAAAVLGHRRELGEQLARRRSLDDLVRESSLALDGLRERRRQVGLDVTTSRGQIAELREELSFLDLAVKDGELDFELMDASGCLPPPPHGDRSYFDGGSSPDTHVRDMAAKLAIEIKEMC